MSQALIDELRLENLCTHFVLPLLRLNKFSFVASNFVNSYLVNLDVDENPSSLLIAVQVVEPELLSRKVLRLHPGFHGAWQTAQKDRFYLLYLLPREYGQDVRLFQQGKFSQMSQKAKDTIRRYSGLPYQEKQKDGKKVTDGRLLALEKHTLLKRMWEQLLSSDDKKSTGRIRLGPNQELLSVPGKESYINLGDLIPR